MTMTIPAVAPASAVGDRAILDAFEARSNEFASTYHLREMPQEQEDAYFKRVEAYEAVIYQTPATTIAGVIAKLRADFMGRVGTDWSDHAIMDPAAPIFVEGLAAADMFTRHAWSVIEDLARIAGTTNGAQIPNAVEAAWTEYWAAMDAMNAAPEAESANGDSPVWQRIKAAGRVIEEADDTGPRVAEIRLWFYFTWVISTQDEWDAVRREDIAWLSEHRNSDEYADAIAIAAIKALRTEALA